MPHSKVKKKHPEENEILKAARIAEELERSLREKEGEKIEVPPPSPLEEEHRSPLGPRDA